MPSACVKVAGIGACSSWISKDQEQICIQRPVATDLPTSLVRNIPAVDRQVKMQYGEEGIGIQAVYVVFVQLTSRRT